MPHVLIGVGKKDETASFTPMHIKDARRWLRDNRMSEELCDHLPIHAMSIKEGHGWPWQWELWIIPVTKEQYTLAKRDGFIPEYPQLTIFTGGDLCL